MVRDTERLFVNPGDYARLRQALEEHFTAAMGIPSTLFGIPVIESDVVPPGYVLKVPQPILRDPVPVWPDDPPLAWYARMHYSMQVVRPRWLGIDLCEGAPYKPPTAAQRRRRAKRFIREEVARRRLSKNAPENDTSSPLGITT